MEKNVTIELQGLKEPHQFEQQLNSLINNEVTIDVKTVNNLTGIETFVVIVSANLSIYIIEKITEFCFETFGVKGKLRNLFTGKESDISGKK